MKYEIRGIVKLSNATQQYKVAPRMLNEQKQDFVFVGFPVYNKHLECI
jgi:hypothetical protein